MKKVNNLPQINSSINYFPVVQSQQATKINSPIKDISNFV